LAVVGSLDDLGLHDDDQVREKPQDAVKSLAAL